MPDELEMGGELLPEFERRVEVERVRGGWLVHARYGIKPEDRTYEDQSKGSLTFVYATLADALGFAKDYMEGKV